MKHKKLKLTNTKDRGFSKREWAEMFLLSLGVIVAGAAILALIIAGVRLVTEMV